MKTTNTLYLNNTKKLWTDTDPNRWEKYMQIGELQAQAYELGQTLIKKSEYLYGPSQDNHTATEFVAKPENDLPESEQRDYYELSMEYHRKQEECSRLEIEYYSEDPETQTRDPHLISELEEVADYHNKLASDAEGFFNELNINNPSTNGERVETDNNRQGEAAQTQDNSNREPAQTQSQEEVMPEYDPFDIDL